jgi:hypothetical protein
MAKPKLSHWSLVIGICVASLLLRLVPLNRYVTPDEPHWVYRSIRFADALSARDWAAIPPTGHPGVTTMWLGATGVAVQRWLDPAESAAQLDWIRRLAWLAPENGEAFRHLAFFLPWGRVAVALVTTLGLAVLYPLLARLFDRRVALVTVGLLAFDPFLAGHSGLLHTDAPLATFCLLALTAALNGRQEPRRAFWWVLAGLFTGLSLLTKIPTLILLPFILFLLAQSAIRNPQSAIVHSSLFIASLLLTIVISYPILWADPTIPLRTLSTFAERHIETVQRLIFFAGQMTRDPGPAFYPVVFLFRVSPLSLIGLVIGWIALRRFPPEHRFAFLLLIAFAVLFGATMTLAAKKHDRYLLPAFPPITLAAALGWEVLSRRVHEAWTSSTHSSFTHLLIPLIQLVLTLPFILRPLTAFNPLAGGSLVAARVLPTNWGEEMGAAACRLNQLPDADQLTVAASSVPSFASLFVGHTVPLDDNIAPLADYIVTAADIQTNTAPFEQADYLAAHAGPGDPILLDADTPLSRSGRYEELGMLLSAASLPDEIAVADWLAQQIPGHETIWVVASPGASPITAVHLRRQVEAIATPVNTVTVASAIITEFATRNSQLITPASSYRAAFGTQLTLVDGALPETVAWPAPLQMALRWQTPNRPKGAPSDHQVVAALRDKEGHTWSTIELPVHNSVNFPTSAWAAGEWSDAAYELSLPPGIPPGHYAVEVSLYDKATGAGLGATGPDGVFRGTRVPVGEVTIAPPVTSPNTAALEIPEPLNIPAGPLTLLGLDPPPAQVLSGDHLPFALFWQADAAPEADYRVCLQLVGSDNQIGLETTPPLSLYPTSHWRARDRFQSHHNLHLPPDLLPGRFRLALNVLDTEGGSFWEQDQMLATVEVLPRECSFTLPDTIPHHLNLTFGETIHLRGYELDKTEATPGGTLALTLYWQADGPADQDYTLFVHLLGPDGLPRGQVDRIPGDGAAPTSSWAAGQVIVEQISLPVAADAPPGIYHIATGFYDASYGSRLLVTDAAGQPLPDDQAILPVEVAIGGQP